MSKPPPITHRGKVTMVGTNGLGGLDGKRYVLLELDDLFSARKAWAQLTPGDPVYVEENREKGTLHLRVVPLATEELVK